MKSESQFQKNLPSYVIVTTARNEEKYIEKTIRSVILQTVLPRMWIIVNDRSTDRTEEIIERYIKESSWIRLVRGHGDEKRNFASKAVCFNAGWRMTNDLKYDVIINLDADVSFESGYFEYLLKRFAEDAELGVAGTAFEDAAIKYNYKYVGLEHVVGICQAFRRECFDQIGGYKIIKGGGVDLVAVLTARMNGWKTRTFTEIRSRHNRSMGTSLSGPVGTRFRYGVEDYYLGSHPIWEMLRCVRHINDKPVIIGGLAILAGYMKAWITSHPRPVSDEFVSFRRGEQMARLKNIVQSLIGTGDGEPGAACR
jgi:poly-beta-1,6-N-acetyl-D-glucosamine synthase